MKKNELAKILLVDDRPENLYALEVILSNENYLCVRASSGAEALQILNDEQDFAIILMDVQMPMMDGFETVELIRQIETIKHVPIIFLTASMDTSVHIFKGYQAGAVDFMIKPLSAEILRAKVAIFVDLYLKTHELLIQKEQLETLNEYVTATNRALTIQNEEKEKIAAELIIANKELMAFNYISSHDLQEPLLKIKTFSTILLESEMDNLSEQGKYNLGRMQLSVSRMQQLISDLLAFSRVKTTERKFEKIDLHTIIEEVKAELKDTIESKQAIIESTELCTANVIVFQFRQLIYNLISNALKFSQADVPSHITIKSTVVHGSELMNKKFLAEKDYCHISIQDNGIGFESKYSERIFEVFQKLHSKDVYAGTGIGLAIVKKIVENHNGVITATGGLNKGAKFDIYISAN